MLTMEIKQHLNQEKDTTLGTVGFGVGGRCVLAKHTPLDDVFYLN
jgi:hypothetical protein